MWNAWLFALVCFTLSGLPFGAVASPGQAQQAQEFDGPAELPRVHVRTALTDTPAPGSVRPIAAESDFEPVLAQAKCGDTLSLAAGKVLHGVFHLPAKACDDSHWIIIRTSAPDTDLPDENTRLTPCFAGVASLPGRPDLRCKSVHNVLARIEYDGTQESGPLILKSGANHYRFIGLEITRGSAGANLRNLAEVEEGGTADHIIFDRVWMHGTAEDETKAGVHLSNMTYAAVINSYFSDFHCIAKAGDCTDAQAVNGGTGNQPGGPYKIANNFLEAAGENIMFGGGAATTTPSDIEILRNYLFKPLRWKPDQADFSGSRSGNPFIVKNHFELKNAARVLFEGNVLENCWGGFTQTGFSILLTPKNQNNVCPLCRVTDVTVRYNRIAHVGSAFQISNGLSGTGGEAAAGERYSIHDVLVEDIDGDKYRGFGIFAGLGSDKPELRHLSIQHITAFPKRALFSIHVPVTKPKIEDVRIQNNIFSAGQRQITSAGGGPNNCAFSADAQRPAGILASCFSNAVLTNNIILESAGGWPKDNIEVRNFEAAGLGSDYRLCRNAQKAGCRKASPGVAAGTDKKDIGVDIDALERAISGGK